MMRYERSVDGRYIINHSGRPPLGTDHAIDNWRTITLGRVGKIIVNPFHLRVLSHTAYDTDRRHVSGEYVRECAVGKPCLTAHMHEFYMANPRFVPAELRGFLVYSLNDIFDGYRGEEYVRAFYFVGNEIRETMTLVQTEIWEEHQVVGLLDGMPLLEKTW